ncbi:MAG: tetratricopeptide repeat protein, partial [Geitlerinemataceae cyanobacterium]
MKRILFFLVMFGFGFLLTWGWIFLPDFSFPKPALGMDSSLPRNSPLLIDRGMGFDEIPMVSLGLPTRTARIDRGRQLYNSGNFEEAVGVWQAVADEEQGLGRSIALSNLSLCLQKLGRWEEATAAVEESVSLLRSFDDLEESERSQILAQTLEIQGGLEFDLGRFDVSLDRWNEAVELYTAIGDRESSLHSQLSGVRSLQALGLYRRAEQTLSEVAATLPEFPDSELKAMGYQHLSYVLRLLGKLGDLPDDLNRSNCQASRTDISPQPESAVEAGLWSLQVAQNLPSTETLHQAQFGLANIARAIYQSQKNFDDSTITKTSAETAVMCYQQAATSTVDSTHLRSKLNLLSFSIDLAGRSIDRPGFQFSSSIQSQLDTQVANWQDLA